MAYQDETHVCIHILKCNFSIIVFILVSFVTAMGEFMENVLASRQGVRNGMDNEKYLCLLPSYKVRRISVGETVADRHLFS